MTVETHQKVKDAIALLHEHRVSQLPVVSSTTRTPSSAPSASAGCSSTRVDNPALMGAEIVDVMEPPFPAVSTTDPVREAVELLSGERPGADGDRRTAGPSGIVTRADLLESLVS